MSAEAKVAEWALWLTVNRDEGEEEPTNEYVLKMFLFSGILDFLEAELPEIEERDFAGPPWDDTEKRVDAWVELYLSSDERIVKVPPESTGFLPVTPLTPDKGDVHS